MEGKKDDLPSNNEENIDNNNCLYENMTFEEKNEYDRMIQNLPMLQDKINQDNQSYKEEFNKILELFKRQFNIVLFRPNKSIKNFKELLLFFSHISNLFQNELSFIPVGLIQILQENYLIIPHEMRLAMVDSLSLLRKKDLLSPLETLPLFFSLMKCQDKILRKKLSDCIISDLTKINSNHKNNEVNKNIQTYCEKLLNEPNKKLGRKTLNIMISLYQKKIWNDSRTVNAIGQCVAVSDQKMSRAACQFFLSEYEVNEIDTSSEEELDQLKNKYKLLGKANNRKTKARKNKLKLLMKSIERKENRHSKVKINKDFMPIDLLNDPLKFSEELFKKANNQKLNFSTKLILIRLLGRVLGRHRLFLENYFNFMLNFITSNQKDIGLIMASLIEACHDTIPPSELEPIINKLFDNFISENFRPPIVTLGLNTLREIIERCPYCITQAQFEEVENLKQYKHKSVSNAARSVVHVCKEMNEKFGRDIGTSFGQNKPDETIEGIDLLKKLEKKPKDYKMEYEEILDDKQLKKLKALKMKYYAELIQHKKTGITDKDINEMAGDKGNEGDEEPEEDDEEEGELEELEEGEGELEEEEGELEELEEEEGELEELEEEEGELEEMPDNGDISLEESEEEVELSSSEIENSSEEEDDDEKNVHGFIDPEKLLRYRKTRREKREELKNQEKEKFKVNKKKKNGGLTNKEKQKNKPLMMVLPKKRLQNKIKSSKLQSMNKKIKGLKQQLGRFKRGNMVLKKKGGLIGKKKAKK